MKLLIDIGNSRVKWGLHDGLDWQGKGAVLHQEVSHMSSVWCLPTISEVFAVNVAAERLRHVVQQNVACEINWVMSERQRDGVVNHYRDLGQQGPDRWLAVIAARQHYQSDLIIACAGTALTIESLTENGEYLGGSILPGYGLMLSSLRRGTAKLNAPAKLVEGIPQATEEAIAAGVMDALSGAIERARLRLSQYTGRALPEVVLTGGDATRIAPSLAIPVAVIDNLVLEGLLRVALDS